MKNLEKNYKYAIRKTTLGVGSVAIAAILAGNITPAQAAEEAETGLETAEVSRQVTDALDNYSPEGDSNIDTEALSNPVPGEALGESEDPAGEGQVDPEAPFAGTEVNQASGSEDTETNQPVSAKTEAVQPVDSEPLEAPRTDAPQANQDTTPKLAQGAELPPTESEDKPNVSTYAVAESSAPNYKEDEAKVGEYAGNDLGETGQYSGTTQEDEKESIKYLLFEPHVKSEDKTRFGFVVHVGEDRDRTFADLLISGTNNNALVTIGDKELLDIGAKPLEGYEVNYKPDGIVSISKVGRSPLTLTFAGEEELLNHINTHKDTTFGFVDHYKEKNIDKAKQIFSESFVSFVMNPYPNENDKFKIIKLNGAEATDVIPAKGQLVKTGARIDNLDENAYERLVSQTYDSKGNVCLLYTSPSPRD